MEISCEMSDSNLGFNIDRRWIPVPVLDNGYANNSIANVYVMT